MDLEFVGLQDDKWVVQVTAILENRSLIRVKYEDFQVTLRYLLMNDTVEDGDSRLAYQLHFPRTIDERIGGAKRMFANAEYINPRQEFKHRYITYLPADATFVWVQCKFFVKLGSNVAKSNTQRIFRSAAWTDPSMRPRETRAAQLGDSTLNPLSTGP